MDIISFPLTPSGPEWRAHKMKHLKVICIPRATRSQLNKWRRSPWPLFPPGPQALVSWWFSSIFVSFFSFSPLPTKSPAFEQVSTTAQVLQRLYPGSSFLPPSIYPSLDERVSEIAFLFQNQRWHDQMMVVCMCVGGRGRGWRGFDLASINSISLHDVSPAMPVNFQGRACSPLLTPVWPSQWNFCSGPAETVGLPWAKPSWLPLHFLNNPCYA